MHFACVQHTSVYRLPSPQTCACMLCTCYDASVHSTQVFTDLHDLLHDTNTVRYASTATWTDRERHLHAVSLLLGPLTAEEEEARQALRSRKRKPDAVSRGSSFSSSSALSRQSVPPLSRQDTFDSTPPSKLSRQSTFNTKSSVPPLSRQGTFDSTCNPSKLSRQNSMTDTAASAPHENA